MERRGPSLYFWVARLWRTRRPLQLNEQRLKGQNKEKIYYCRYVIYCNCTENFEINYKNFYDKWQKVIDGS